MCRIPVGTCQQSPEQAIESLSALWVGRVGCKSIAAGWDMLAPYRKSIGATPPPPRCPSTAPKARGVTRGRHAQKKQDGLAQHNHTCVRRLAPGETPRNSHDTK